MPVDVKICGLNTPETVDAAAEYGARFVGFVFYPRSPRNVSIAVARDLTRRVPTGVRCVGLFVDPTDDLLRDVTTQVPLDLLQLHGAESPARVAAIKNSFSLPVMKALKIATAEDLAAIQTYAPAADWLLFDARPPENVSALPGGNALSFDWTLLQGLAIPRPWMLAGGLTADNVQEAMATSGAPCVDVSSGIEDRPGHKTVEKIKTFLDACAEQ